MAELLAVYTHCQFDQTEFEERVHPLFLDDAKLGSGEERAQRVAYWRHQLEVNAAVVRTEGTRTSRAVFDRAKWLEHLVQHLLDILTILTRHKYAPRGYAAIVANDFLAVKVMLRLK